MLSGSSSRPTILRGDPHESGVTGSARQARQEQAARHSQPQRSSMCTKCVLTLMTRLAPRVIRGAPVPMIVITKAPLVSHSIGLSCAGMPVSSHGQALVMQALLIM